MYIVGTFKLKISLCISNDTILNIYRVLLFTGSQTTPATFAGNHDPVQGPVFISEPRSSITFLNTKGITVHCTAYGRPAPAMDWIMADGSDVTDKPGLMKVLPNNSLYFQPFSEADFNVDVHTGSYRCMASNTGGVIVSRKVTVNAGKMYYIMTPFRSVIHLKAPEIYHSKQGFLNIICNHRNQLQFLTYFKII